MHIYDLISHHRIDRSTASRAKPHEITHRFEQLVPNIELLDKLWRKHQQDYLRTRLRTIRLLWQGYSRQEIIELLDIGYSSIIRWMRLLVEYGVDTGLQRLVTPKKAPKSGKLSYDQQATLIEIIKHQKPSDYGFEQSIFTGEIVVKIVEQLWGIRLSDQTIYNLLRRHRFSHQRGHRDYEPADPEEQHIYAEHLKKRLKHPSLLKK